MLNNLNVETWLQEHIPDQTVSAAGYNLIRRDRCVGQHGGVCAYIRKTIRYQVLENLLDGRFELLSPPRLPRSIPNIILGIVYHPPGTDCLSMIQYLYECLTIIESEFPNNGTILLRDFNKLKVSRIQNAFKLKQVVKFLTRGRNILDLILTDLDKFYDSPRKLPPFGLSDHDSVFVPPQARSQVPNPTYRTKSRDLRPTKRLALTRYLEEVNVNQLVNNQISSDDKAKTFEMIINTGLDAIAPTKEKVIITNEPPWPGVFALQKTKSQSPKSLYSGRSYDISQTQKSSKTQKEKASR